MIFQLNGQPHEIKTGTTIPELLTQLQLKHDRVVIELNGEILADIDRNSTAIKEDDKLEIIQFVGGG